MNAGLLWNNVLGAPGGNAYIAKVLGYSPIAYFPQGEASGTDILCQINALQNGTYTGVTLGQDGIGDGGTCPLYDGANDMGDIETATLDSAFNGQLGSFMVWAKVSGAGVWTDSTSRYPLILREDAQNYLYVGRTTVNGQLLWRYEAGDTMESVYKADVSETGWMMLGATWSLAADAFKAYYYTGGSGGQNGSTQTGLGTYVGSIDNRAIIGAGSTAPSGVWDGTLAHLALWDSVLTEANFDDLAVVV